jgi:hypothetical protein
MIIKCGWALNLLSKTFKIIDIGAMTIKPFIFVREEFSTDAVKMNHEKIHLAQQKEVGLFKWLKIYLEEYYKFEKTAKKKSDAYYKITFEKEAYANEENLDYLKTRKPFTWKLYL